MQIIKTPKPKSIYKEQCYNCRMQLLVEHTDIVDNTILGLTTAEFKCPLCKHLQSLSRKNELAYRVFKLTPIKDYEKKIKAYLKTKSKDTIINLYLQVKYERDVLQDTAKEQNNVKT